MVKSFIAMIKETI